MNIESLLQEVERRHHIIISDTAEDLTGIQFYKRVYDRFSFYKKYLPDNGYPVLLRMTNDIEAIVSMFALLLNKQVVFIANPHDPVSNLETIIKRFSIFSVIADKATCLAINKRLPLNKEDIFKCDNSSIRKTGNTWLRTIRQQQTKLSHIDHRMTNSNIAIFSSGTTGKPKAILNNFNKLILNAKMHADSIGIKSTDVVGVKLPVYYSYGLVANFLGAMVSGAKIVIYSHTGEINTEWLRKEKVSVLSLTPFFASQLKENIPSLRILTLGGDRLYSAQAKQLINILPNCQLMATYGLTEAGPRVSTCLIDKNNLDQDEIPLGTPLSNVIVKLEKTNELKSNMGELIIKSPTSMEGYYLGEKDGFLPFNSNTDWVVTGDLFEVKNHKYYFLNRKKHIIIQGGEKIYPAVIEAEIKKIHGVTNVRVHGVKDDNQEEIAKALIVAEKNISLEQVKRKLLGSTSRSRIPKQFEFVDYIPRNKIGKIA